MAALPIVKDWAQYKNAELIVTHLFKVSDNCLWRFLDEPWVTIFEHPLDDPAAILVEAILDNILLNLVYE